MKCTACDKSLTGSEQTFDHRRGQLEDMCSECLNIALEENEGELLAMAKLDLLSKEDEPNESV